MCFAYPRDKRHSPSDSLFFSSICIYKINRLSRKKNWDIVVYLQCGLFCWKYWSCKWALVNKCPVNDSGSTRVPAGSALLPAKLPHHQKKKKKRERGETSPINTDLRLRTSRAFWSLSTETKHIEKITVRKPPWSLWGTLSLQKRSWVPSFFCGGDFLYPKT